MPSKTNIIGILNELVEQEKNEKVRRSAIATLGELLFYISIQTTPNQTNTTTPTHVGWYIPDSSIALLPKCLKISEDPIVVHYAAKTIENVRDGYDDCLVKEDG